MKRFVFLALVILGIFLSSASKTVGGSIRVGVLPILESLPFIVAQEKGFFQALGLEVEIVSFASALERDSAIQSGSLQGAIHDILGVSLLKNRGLPFTIVTNMTLPTEKKDLFVLLAAPGADLKSLSDLRGSEIALSSHTIAEYVTDSLLALGGLKIQEVKKVEVKKIPLRFQMLMEGKVKGATLPEPLASLAIFQGARKIRGDWGLKGTQVVLVFQDSFIQEQGEAMVRFGRAYRKAVQVINEDPQRWRSLLVEKGRLPAAIREVYLLNPFSDIQLPLPEEIQAVRSWMEGKGLVTSKASYPSLVSEVWVKGVR